MGGGQQGRVSAPAVSQDNPVQDVAKERAEATFQILDTNHDGQLNEEEFVEVQFVFCDLTGLRTVTVTYHHSTSRAVCLTQISSLSSTVARQKG